jgi:hypothetical protein
VPSPRTCRRTAKARAALSISPFERSRWRLRRTRQAMAKAARFRLLFGWMIGQFASPELCAAGFAARFETAEVDLAGRREGRAVPGLCSGTPLLCGPKPVALSPGSGYEESIRAFQRPAAWRAIAAESRSTTIIAAKQTGHGIEGGAGALGGTLWPVLSSSLRASSSMRER